jgi:prepilin-type processing-associated H-X9-DG protein
MEGPNHGRVSRAARVSALLGVCSLLFGAVTGLPALYLGLLGVRAVNMSDGAVRGWRLAVAGMVLGALGSLVTLVGVGLIVITHLTVRANRLDCVNNLRQLGMATARYGDAHDNTFPPAAVPNPKLRPERRLSWVAILLPYIGERDSVTNKRYKALADKLDLSRGWASPRNAELLNTALSVCLCRSHPEFEPRPVPGVTHFVGLSGIGPNAAELPTSSPRAGIFGYDRRVRRQDLTAGLSCTMMIVETTYHNGPWLAAGEPTVRELAPDETHYIGRGRPFGGLHSGGLNVLWADGSVRWVSDRVPPEDFRTFATLAGKPEGPGPE